MSQAPTRPFCLCFAHRVSSLLAALLLRRVRGPVPVLVPVPVAVAVAVSQEFGTGPESTLGSRKRKGCVEIHDSFKYDSTYYAIAGYHWRSLDTWLDGKCDPLLQPEHWSGHDTYGAAAQRLGKRSIFAAEVEEAAEESDDEEGPGESGGAAGGV